MFLIEHVFELERLFLELWCLPGWHFRCCWFNVIDTEIRLIIMQDTRRSCSLLRLFRWRTWMEAVWIVLLESYQLLLLLLWLDNFGWWQDELIVFLCCFWSAFCFMVDYLGSSLLFFRTWFLWQNLTTVEAQIFVWSCSNSFTSTYRFSIGNLTRLLKEFRWSYADFYYWKVWRLNALLSS